MATVSVSFPSRLNAAKQANIPVVMVDRKLKGGEYASWIGPDNATIGKQDDFDKLYAGILDSAVRDYSGVFDAAFKEHGLG